MALGTAKTPIQHSCREWDSRFLLQVVATSQWSPLMEGVSEIEVKSTPKGYTTDHNIISTTRKLYWILTLLQKILPQLQLQHQIEAPEA